MRFETNTMIVSLLLTALLVLASEQQLLESVNGTRKAAGVSPVCLSQKISQAAQVQSQYQASVNRMTHDGTQDVGTRILQAGFKQAGAGECVGMSNPDNLSAVYQAWVNDPPHYAIIVNPSFTHMGWSKEQGSGGAYYYTLDFAKADEEEACDSEHSAAIVPAESGVPEEHPPVYNQPVYSSRPPPARQQPQVWRQTNYRRRHHPPPVYHGPPKSGHDDEIASGNEAQLLSQYETQIQQMQAQIAALRAQQRPIMY